MKLRASINKTMLNGGEQHLQLPMKGLSAAQITSSLKKRVGYTQQRCHHCWPACAQPWPSSQHLRRADGERGNVPGTV